MSLLEKVRKNRNEFIVKEAFRIAQRFESHLPAHEAKILSAASQGLKEVTFFGKDFENDKYLLLFKNYIENEGLKYTQTVIQISSGNIIDITVHLDV